MVSRLQNAEEEREVWTEMKEHFEENFEEKVKAVIKAKGSQEVVIPPEEEEFKKRLEVLEQRKKETIEALTEVRKKSSNTGKVGDDSSE